MIVRTLAFLATLAPAASRAAQDRLPSPATVIYPGDVIAEASLVDVERRDLSYPGGAVVSDRAMLVGRAARRTLLPGMAISPNWVEAPRAIANGAQVRVVFREDGMTILSRAAALQSGAVGDRIRLRSIEGGGEISGVVQDDGSVRVGDR